MLPSTTPSGRAWLDNFVGPDVPAATLLLDSLRFVGLGTLRSRLKDMLDGLVTDRRLRTPAWVLPERSLTAPELAIPADRRHEAVAWEDFHPGAPISVTPGSDGFVGGILRDYAPAGRSSPNPDWIPPDAGIELLRERRCRSILLVTDYIGSGQRVIDLARAIARNRTIRSWRSLHLVDIYVVAFAANPAALSRFRASGLIKHVWIAEGAPTFLNQNWPNDVLDSIEELCRRGCRLRHEWALGYNGSRGLFATERGAPNNLPAVFWQTHPTWHPLFPHRTVPVDVVQDFRDYVRRRELRELATSIRQVRIGLNERLDYMRATSREVLKVLILIHDGQRDTAALAAGIGLPVHDVEALLHFMRRTGWVDPTNRVTDSGRLELAAQRRRRRRTTAHLEGSEVAYYPESLK